MEPSKQAKLHLLLFLTQDLLISLCSGGPSQPPRFVAGLLADGAGLPGAVIPRGCVKATLPLKFLLPILAKPLEGQTELLGHEVVDDGVDGAVGVDADPAEEDKPAVQVGVLHEGVHQNQGPVGHPEQGKEGHHHSQHLGDLEEKEGAQRASEVMRHSFERLALRPGKVACQALKFKTNAMWPLVTAHGSICPAMAIPRVPRRPE